MEFGKARIERPGDHCTIVTFSRMTDLSLAAAAELEKIGVSVEVINLLRWVVGLVRGLGF